MRILDGRNKLYQWDKDIRISGEFTIGEEIHFSTRATVRALVVKAYEFNGEVVADVPNILLTQPYNITAYRYVEDENGSYTKDEQLFEVEGRAKPDDYVYTQTEVFSFNDLKKEIEDIMGDVSSSLDRIIEIQNSLIGGDVE